MKRFLIREPVLHLHEECSMHSPLVSQGIYGHSAWVIEEVGDRWAKIETEDGYKGYGQVDALVDDDPRWRTSRNQLRVCSVAGWVYPRAEIESRPLMKLSFDSRVELIRDEGRWVQVRLVEGEGWMQRGDVEKPKTRTLEEMVELSHRFKERPYVWGGTSSEGYDCSGYVQTLCKQMGVRLERDSVVQATSEKTEVIDAPEKGDLVFFGEGRVTHVGLYLGEDKFIHAGVKDDQGKISVSSLAKTSYNFLFARRLKEVEYRAEVQPLDDLCHIKLNHWGFDRCVHEGELIVHESVVDEVVEIFGEMFKAHYPIEKMRLIDEYGGDDEKSCADNNTSAYCKRLITGSETEWSMHSYGLAIDINPLLNPYCKGDVIVPQSGEPFLDRSIDCRGMIKEGDACYEAFISRGWEWGGDWGKERGYVDYQHFATNPRS